MTPDWLNNTVRAFGRQLGLKEFAMNERGAAGVRFERAREPWFPRAQREERKVPAERVASRAGA